MRELIHYIDLRIEELKLNTSNGLSGVISLILSMFIVAVLAIVLLVFLALALMQWLNKPEMLGEPYGTLVSAGAILLILVVLFIIRRSLFHKPVNKSISSSLGLSSSSNIKDIKSQIKWTESKMTEESTILRILKKLFS